MAASSSSPAGPHAWHQARTSLSEGIWRLFSSFGTFECAQPRRSASTAPVWPDRFLTSRSLPPSASRACWTDVTGELLAETAGLREILPGAGKLEGPVERSRHVADHGRAGDDLGS